MLLQSYTLAACKANCAARRQTSSREKSDCKLKNANCKLLARPRHGWVEWQGCVCYEDLYDFTGGTDGGYPQGDLLLSSGTFFGMAEEGGITQLGTVFALTLPTPTPEPGTLALAVAGGAAALVSYRWRRRRRRRRSVQCSVFSFQYPAEH